MSSEGKYGRFFGFFLVAAGLILSLPAGAQPKKSLSVHATSLTQLGWLAGQWRSEKNGTLMETHWMTPAGGAMFGMSRTMSKGRVVEFASAQIREGPGGDLFYITQAAGGKAVTLKSVNVTPAGVEFVNQLTDFPQSITMTVLAPDKFALVIAGLQTDGQTKQVEYTCQRF